MDIKDLIILGGGIAFLIYYNKKSSQVDSTSPVLIRPTTNQIILSPQDVQKIDAQCPPSRSKGKNRVSYRGSL